MPSVKLSPLFNDAQLDNNGLPLSGGMVYWYLAGTTTPVIVYTESSGSTANTNPVILNTRGEPVQPIWLQTGKVYKAIITDSIGNLIRTVDNISGINDTSIAVISEWVLYSGAATYISGTSFSVLGDATATFDANRRVKATVSGTDRYGTVNGAPVFALGVTTVTLVLDSGVLDASLATVYFGFMDPAHPSYDNSAVNTNTQAGIQKQSWTAFTTGGSSGVYTLTPLPAISAYTANQRFNVTFNAISAATNTINVSGLGAKALKTYNSAGAKVNPIFALNQISDIVYDGTDFVVLDMADNNQAGTIIAFSGTAAPTGYLACPTSATNISRTTYANLFTALNTTWGAGDGSTTFGMPYFPTGYSPIAGTPGTVSVGAVIAHVHAMGRVAGGSGSLQFSGGAGMADISPNTASTGGTANFAAGANVLMCVKY